MRKELVFKIDMETAKVEMEAVGFKGQGCKEASRAYEDALGVVEDRTNKSVMFSQFSEEEQHIKVQG